MKKLIALLLIACLAAVAFGCTQQAAPAATQAPAAATQAPATTDGGNSGGEQTTDEPQVDVNVVLLAPMSGPYASLGVLNDAGMQGFAARFEERGGFVNHPNWKLNYSVADHEISAEVCMGLFERLQEETAVFAIAQSTMSIIACQPLAIKYEKPIVGVCIIADRALEQNNPWTFRVCPGDKDMIATHGSFLAFLEEYSGYEFNTFAMVYTSDDYGLGLPESFGKGAEALGGECVLEEVIQYGQATDLSGVVSKIRQANPDVILASCTAVEAGILTKTLKQFEVKTPMVTAGAGFADAAFFESIGPNGADGATSCQVYIPDVVEYGPDPELAKQWITKTEEMTGHGWTEQVVHGWLVLSVICEVLDNAESLSGQDIVASFHNIDIPADHDFNWYTLFAGCKFGEKDGRYGQNIYAACMYGQIQDDTYRLVYLPAVDIPKDTNPLVWPIQSWQTADWATASAAAQ